MKKCLPKQNGCLIPDNCTYLHPHRVKFLFLIVISFFSLNLFAQNRITGRVASRDTALQGVTVTVKGGTAATQTDANGNFTITAPSDATLVVSNVGFANQEVKVGNKSNIVIQMVPTTAQLTDVVVVGYGVQKKVTVTGAVSAVKGSDLDKSPSTNLSNSLAGRLPGVTAIQAGGEPGRDGSTILFGEPTPWETAGL